MARGLVFSYAFGVKTLLWLRWLANRTRHMRVLALISAAFLSCGLVVTGQTESPQRENPDTPVVTKVEPPSWWIHMSPEAMLLLSGHNLQATKVWCNLSSLVVERTQSTARGDYLFVWLQIGSDTLPGTAICRITTPAGKTSFELPLAARGAKLGKFQGISNGDSIYLIMPDRFANGDPTNDEPTGMHGTHDRSNPRAYHGGDLKGVREHLPYLKDLGITTILLTPISKEGVALDDHGSGAIDLYTVDPHLGTIEDYRALVAEAHKQGMKVMFDFVANYVGPTHPWVAEPPMQDWFHGTPQRHLDSSSGTEDSSYGKQSKISTPNNPFELLTDPHAPPQWTRNLTDGWVLGKLPDLNTENQVVAQYLLQNAIWWAETSGLDGYRLDTFPYVPRNFWSTWNENLHRFYPFLTTIGEVFHPDPTVAAFFAGGEKRFDGIDSGVSALFDYPLCFAIRDVLLENAPPGRIADVLRSDWLYPHPESLVTFFGNHDLPRIAGTTGGSPDKIKAAFGLLLTVRGIPEIYAGDEIGMQGGGDPDNRRDFPGGWPGDAANAFTAQGRSAQQQEIFSYTQELLRLRSQHPALQNGKLWHLASDDRSYVFLRESEDEKILVAFNGSAEERGLKIQLDGTPAQGAAGLTRLLGNAKADVFGGEIRIAMPSQSVSIFVFD